MINKITLAKSIKEISIGLPAIHRLKSIGRPIISPLNYALSFIKKNDKLCDIGCGNGTLLHLALEFSKVNYAYGYDVSKEAINNNVVKSYSADKCQLNCTDKLPDLRDFNTVTLFDVLHHIPKKKQVSFLKKIVDKMSKSTQFILMDINASQFIGRWANQCHDLLISQEWVHPMKMKDVLQLFDTLNVEIVHKRKYQTFWYSHYIIVIKKK
jgi:2-polyprenyl-3-methyl-5-hydroxy-6-metoxy-1,4-benzoquinol methylase